MSEDRRRQALRFVVGFGVVSLFADFTYEGGHSIVGPYLASLGASAFFAGAVGGAGEFLGYAVRLFSGRFVDRTHRHWLVLTVGYVVNLASVPLMALAATPWLAGSLVFTERLGKGVRAPARDALLAEAGHELGQGYAFGLHEFLDQLGAILGPVTVAAAVAYSGYRLGFAVLTLPAILALFFLWRLRGQRADETKRPPSLHVQGFSAAYYVYLAFSVLSVLGYVHFVIVTYHLQYTHRLAPALIPLLFGLAMGVDAVAAFLSGWLYDRLGMKVVLGLPLLALPAMPLLFLADSPSFIWLGGALWGAAMGFQESAARAGVATLTPPNLRGTAYGLFDAAYGLAWFLGSLLLGALYGYGAQWIAVAAIVCQLLSVPFLLLAIRLNTQPEKS